MSFIETVQRVSQEHNTLLLPEEIEEISFLLENDVTLFHLAKSHLEDAIHEAILYISPEY